MGGLWYGGRCGQEFTKGLLCSIPDMILEIGRLIGESAKYAWNNRKICVPVCLVLGGFSPLAAGPILACGAGFMLVDKIPKAIKCARTSFAGKSSGGGNLWQTVLERVQDAEPGRRV